VDGLLLSFGGVGGAAEAEYPVGFFQRGILTVVRT